MPTWPYNDEHITDRTEIEQCRTRRNSGFQACLDAISEMGRILSECGEVGWKAFEEKSREYLMARLGGVSEDLQKKFGLSTDTNPLIEFEGGDEHYILLFSEEHRDQRVLKWTHGDNFGLHLKVFEINPDAMNHHVISSGNPEDNILLGDAAPRNIRFENGTLVPFDAVAEHPEGLAKRWCTERIKKSS